MSADERLIVEARQPRSPGGSLRWRPRSMPRLAAGRRRPSATTTPLRHHTAPCREPEIVLHRAAVRACRL